jgi:hypothetical protein
MPVISRIVSMGLRACELAFAGVSATPNRKGPLSNRAQVVAGVVGSYLDDHRGNGWPLARFIYIEIVAGISLLLGLLWLLPFAGGFFHCKSSAIRSGRIAATFC